MPKEAHAPSIHFSLSNVNYVGAIVFTVGCSVLVVNAVLSFLPYISSTLKPPAGVIYIEGALSLMSNALFLCGSAFAFVQIINAQRDGQEQTKPELVAPAIKPEQTDEKASEISNGNADFSSSSDNLTTVDMKEAVPEDSKSTTQPPLPDEEMFRYMPTSHEMWTRCIHEMGFLATSIFFCSSVVYFSSSIASIITIAQTGEIARWIRYPQLVAAVGFAIASIMMMIQRQHRWWQPAWHSFRWYANLWNLVGSAGFIFCACFGLIENVAWAKYQFGMSYLWGSWAFLFGSVLQWYKSLAKNNADKAKEWA